MYCRKCGAQIDDDATFCQYCGASTTESKIKPEYYNSPAVQSEYTAPPPTNGCAIAGFVLAFFMPLIGFILSIVGFIKAGRECRGNGKGLAIAGLVISFILLLVYILVIAMFVLAMIA